MDDLLHKGERIEDLMRNGLKIIQNPEMFRYGMDAILLSHFARVRAGANVVDIGTGTGIIPILLTSLSCDAYIRAVEIQESMADMATRSVRLNKLEDRIKIICADIREYKRLFAHSSMDIVISNPPYMEHAHGIQNANKAYAIARHEILCRLEDVITATSYILKQGGKLCMVHRPHRLGEIIYTLKKYNFEVKRLRFVHPYINKPANMVLIEASKGGGVWLEVEKPITVYREAGVYTEQIKKIYGHNL